MTTVNLSGVTLPEQITAAVAAAQAAAEAAVEAAASAGGYLQVTPEVYGSHGDGTTDDYAALNSAALFAQSTGAALILSRPYKIGTSLTINCNVHFLSAGKIVVPDGKTLTVNGYVTSTRPTQIAGGWAADTSTSVASTSNDKNRIKFNTSQVFRPEWFGAVGNGTANDKPAFQRMAYAVPQDFIIECTANKTYLFDVGGMYDAAALGINATALFTSPGNIALHLNGATIKMADNAGYSALAFVTGYMAGTYNGSFRISGGILDGNRAGNEARFIANSAATGNTNGDQTRYYDAIVHVDYYRVARCQGVDSVNTIYNGVSFQDCFEMSFEACTGKNGFPMKYDTYGSQSYYYKGSGDNIGPCSFQDIKTEDGSHGIGYHTTLSGSESGLSKRMEVHASQIWCKNYAESGIHFERFKKAHISDFDLRIDDVSVASANVFGMSLRPYSTDWNEIDCTVKGGTILNDALNIDLTGMPNLPPDCNVVVDSVKIYKTMDLTAATEPTIAIYGNSGIGGRAVNCVVRGTPTYPITGRAITAGSTEGCVIEYCNGATCIQNYHRSTNDTVRHGTGNAVGFAGPGYVSGLRTYDMNTGILTASDVTVVNSYFELTRGNCIATTSGTPSVTLRNNRYLNWGTNTGLSGQGQRSAIGGPNTDGNGIFAGTLTCIGDEFTIDTSRSAEGTNDPANAYNIPAVAGRAGTVVHWQPAYKGAGIYREAFGSTDDLHYYAASGKQTVTGPTPAYNGVDIVELNNGTDSAIKSFSAGAVIEGVRLQLKSISDHNFIDFASGDTEMKSLQGYATNQKLLNGATADLVRHNGFWWVTIYA